MAHYNTSLTVLAFCTFHISLYWWRIMTEYLTRCGISLSVHWCYMTQFISYGFIIAVYCWLFSPASHFLRKQSWKVFLAYLWWRHINLTCSRTFQIRAYYLYVQLIKFSKTHQIYSPHRILVRYETGITGVRD